MKLFRVPMAVGAVVVIAPGARAQTPTTVTAAIGSNMNHVPSFVGVEKGIFLKHGIDVKLKILSTGQEMSKALQAGNAQPGGAAVSNVPLAAERGSTAPGGGGSMGGGSQVHPDAAVTRGARHGSGRTG